MSSSMIRFAKIVFAICFCFYLVSIAIFYGQISVAESRGGGIDRSAGIIPRHSKIRRRGESALMNDEVSNFKKHPRDPSKEKDEVRWIETNAIKESRAPRKGPPLIKKKGIPKMKADKDMVQVRRRKLESNPNYDKSRQDQPKRKLPVKKTRHVIANIPPTKYLISVNKTHLNSLRNPLKQKSYPLEGFQKQTETKSSAKFGTTKQVNLRKISSSRQRSAMTTLIPRVEDRKRQPIDRSGRKNIYKTKASKNGTQVVRRRIGQENTHPVKVLLEAAKKNLTQSASLKKPYPKRRFIKDANRKNPPIQHSNFTEVVPNVYLYSAYADDRNNSKFIRLITITKTYGEEVPPVFCHFRFFSHGRYFHFDSSQGKFYKTCEDHGRTYSAFIISCPLPEDITIDQVLQRRLGVFLATSNSVSAKMTEIEIINNRMTRSANTSSINVCVPPLFGDVKAERLVEFIELTEILGATHFTLYLYNVNQEVKNVMHMYENVNEVTTLPWRLPMKDEHIWYYGQSVSVWDCQFRNMYAFDYISFNDIDEYILPRHDAKWQNMLVALDKAENHNKNVAGYRFLSAFFDNGDRGAGNYSADVKNLVSMETVWRSSQVSDLRTKLLVDPRKVFELGIHHLSKPMEEQYHVINVSPEVALVHHYRFCEDSYGMRCDDFNQDKTMWRHLGNLVQNVKAVYKQLKLNSTRGNP